MWGLLLVFMLLFNSSFKGQVISCFNSSVKPSLFSSINCFTLEMPYWANNPNNNGITNFFKLSMDTFNSFSIWNSIVISFSTYSLVSKSPNLKNSLISSSKDTSVDCNLITPKSFLASAVDV